MESDTKHRLSMLFSQDFIELISCNVNRINLKRIAQPRELTAWFSLFFASEKLPNYPLVSLCNALYSSVSQDCLFTSLCA